MKENKVSRVLKDQAIWLVFIVLVIAFTIANPRFITMSNLLIMLRQVAVWGIASVGMMFVILLGDIDLGTGSVITFVNILCAKLMVEFGVNMYLAVLISLLASTLIGLLNGFMVATIGIPALIATFATQTAFSGIALIMCNGQPINGFPEKFSVFGAGWVGPVPIPVIIMIICFIIGAFILNKTYFGRYFYAVGGNIEAARLSGIRTGRVKYLVFALSGFFAGLAGIVLLSRTNSGMGNAGLGYEFKVITCVVLGGVSVAGGSGKMSGVVTYQRSGEPGYDGATIRIRGSNTLGNNDPLIVIDGVAARAGGLERLDPNEIETMSVLKDASAAIYGARAANGVILITTKKGRAGKKPEFTYSFNQGWSKPTNLPEMCDAVEYSELMNELYMNKAMLNPAKNNGQTMGEYTLFRTPEEIELYRNGNDPWRYPNTDWYAATFKNWSPQRVHNASLEGGSDKYQYFVNFGHKYTDGLYHKSANNYKQFNLRMNVDAQFNDYIKVGAQLMGRQENRNFPSQGAGDLLWFTSRGRPTDQAYWPNGLPGPAQEYGRNPVVACTDETGYTHDKRYYIQSNAKVEITQPWIEGLKLTASVSYDKYLKQSKTWFQPWTLYDWDKVSYEADGKTPKLTPMLSYPSHEDPDLSMESTDQTNTILSGILTYDRNFGDHGVNFLIGMERDWSNAESFNAYRRYFLSNALHHFNAGGDKEKNAKSDGDNWERARMNYFGRMAYNYKEKYLAEFVWRYDGSYMFAEGNRFGFFPGVLLGYRISEEDFWKENLSFIDYFKIRASWGQMGNDQVYFDNSLREYQFSPTYYYEWGYIIDNADEKGLRISRFPNPNITWERANNFNIGIETRTFDNRLYLEADYFYNKRSNILWRRNASIPTTSGLTLPAENIGKVDNTGFDFKIEWSDNIGKDWHYSISATGGYAKNTIKFWDEVPGAPEWQKSTGHPMNTSLYYEYDGVFKDWDEINDIANRPNYDGITKDADLRPGDMKSKTWTGTVKSRRTTATAPTAPMNLNGHTVSRVTCNGKTSI